MFKPKQAKGVASLVVLSFFFGATAISVRYLGLVLPLFQQIYITTAIAFLISLLFFKRTLTFSRLKKISLHDWGIIIFRIVVGYIIAVPLYRESIAIAKISNVTFLQSIPFGAVFGWLLFKDKFSWKKLFYVIVAYLGVILIAVSDFSSILNFGRGELFSIISAAFFALSFLARKWLSDDLTDKELTHVILFVSTIIIFFVSIVAGEGLPSIKWTWVLFWAALFTGFFNAVNILLINYGFKRVKAVLAGNIITLESVFALVLAFLFFRELPSLKELFGGALIIASVIQMNRISEG